MPSNESSSGSLFEPISNNALDDSAYGMRSNATSMRMSVSTSKITNISLPIVGSARRHARPLETFRAIAEKKLAVLPRTSPGEPFR
jgi:hypothetical protein